MTHKERMFVDAYVGEARFCASAAARIAGYKDPGQSGWENKQKPDIRQAIDAHLARMTLTSTEVLARLTEIANSTVADVISVNKSGSVKVDLKQAAAHGKLHLVKSVKKGKFGLEVELHSSHEALRDLGKALGVFSDTIHHDGEIRVRYVNDWRGGSAGAEATPAVGDSAASAASGAADHQEPGAQD